MKVVQDLFTPRPALGGGVVYAPFFLLDAFLFHGTANFFDNLELRGKGAATLAMLFCSILIFAVERRTSGRLIPALLAQLVFLLGTTNLPIVSQASWIHGPTILVFTLYLFVSTFFGAGLVLRGVLLGLVVAVRPIAILGLPIMWRFAADSNEPRKSIFAQLCWAALVVSLAKGYELYVGMSSSYVDELAFSLKGIFSYQTLYLLLLEFISPNGGMLVFYPSLFVVLLLSIKYCTRRDFISLALPVLLYFWLGSWWWAGLSSAGPLRLLSDCNVHLALLTSGVYQAVPQLGRRLIEALSVVVFVIGLHLQRFGWHDMTLPNREPLLLPADNLIDRTQRIRAQNDLAKPYLITEIFK